MYNAAPASDVDTSWQESSLLGVSQVLFNVIFRTSQLRRRLPLNNSDRLEARRLSLALRDWHWSQNTSVFSSPGEERPPDGMLLTSQLYHSACLMYLEKVMDISLQSSHTVVRSIIENISQIIRQMSLDDVQQSIHLWPLLILGFAAVTPWERNIFKAPFEGPRNFHGFGSVQQAYNLLQRSWCVGETDGKVLGLDTLLQDDLLCQIFI